MKGTRLLNSLQQRGALLSTILIAFVLVGCPLLPLLTVSTTALSFGKTSNEESFTILNTGGGVLTWTVTEEIPWLTVETGAGTTTKETDRITLTVDRSALPPGTHNGTLTVSSNGGDTEILIGLVVAGAPTIQVTPETLSFFGEAVNEQQIETGQFTITNLGTGPLTWELKIEEASQPGVSIPQPAFMTIQPKAAVTASGAASTVTVEINRSNIEDGIYNFVFVIGSDAGLKKVTVNIGVGVGPEISVEPSVLDFGASQTTLSFDVFNTGDTGSVLQFSLATNRPDLVLFEPASGSSTATGNPLAPDRQPISVTIDRNALTGATDGGNITITAPGAAALVLPIIAEAAPLTFEGAVNRSRPPFLQRFVFILRDGTGEAIDSTNPGIFAQLQNSFSVFEDGLLLDPAESSLFITSGESLKYNLTLLLDFTGSMNDAPPGNGVAIQEMVSATREFITDLPSGYRVSIMEYHERQQPIRLIQGFTTSKQTLLDSLDLFSLPIGENGASEIFDAVTEAAERLRDEDIGATSFDDADVRALVFISDGRDTSSVEDLQSTATLVQDARVRLYAIGYGQNVKSAPLIELATKSGGHYYSAANSGELRNLLANESALGASAPGVIAKDLNRQIVLTYLSLFQDGTHNYLISAEFNELTGSFARDAVIVYGGDVRGGQVSLRSSGVQPDGSAEVFVYADYVPRAISQMRFRFFTGAAYSVELAQNGLVDDWVLLDEGGGVYRVITTEDNPIQYGAFGNLLKLTFTGLAAPSTVGFRVDNRVYVNPPFTKFFQYPDEVTIGDATSQATVVPLLVSDGFDPDAPFAFNRDGDALDDFDDPIPAPPAPTP